jgi:HD-GYP domain-containing protein (c-di-GMP phosphodiesterase class II)
MLRSKDISDFFEAKLTDLRAGVELTFDVYLYFKINEHIILWRKKGDVPQEEFLQTHHSKGLSTIWIFHADQEAFLKYLHPVDSQKPHAPAPQRAPAAPSLAPQPPTAAPTPSQTAASPAAPVPPSPESPQAAAEPTGPKTEEGKRIVEALHSQELSPEKVEEVVAAEAQDVLAAVGEAETVSEQKLATEKARAVVKDVLDSTLSEAESLVAEVWKMAQFDVELEHAVNVATYSLIFAMAFGRTNPAVLADLALAAILHDIGISQIPAEIASTPWRKMTPPQLKVYSTHVAQSIDLINAYEPKTAERAKNTIFQHHEKFDGSGYPTKKQGFKVDDLGQLLSVADVMDSIAAGRWDGVERTYRDTFQLLEKLEKARTYPEFFNPEIFASVVRWIRKNAAGSEATKAAIASVAKQAEMLLKQAG